MSLQKTIEKTKPNEVRDNLNSCSIQELERLLIMKNANPEKLFVEIYSELKNHKTIH